MGKVIIAIINKLLRWRDQSNRNRSTPPGPVVTLDGFRLEVPAELHHSGTPELPGSISMTVEVLATSTSRLTAVPSQLQQIGYLGLITYIFICFEEVIIQTGRINVVAICGILDRDQHINLLLKKIQYRRHL